MNSEDYSLNHLLLKYEIKNWRFSSLVILGVKTKKVL